MAHGLLDELAARVDPGDLSQDEETEYEALVDGLAILKAKARGIVDQRRA